MLLGLRGISFRGLESFWLKMRALRLCEAPGMGILQLPFLRKVATYQRFFGVLTDLANNLLYI